MAIHPNEFSYIPHDRQILKPNYISNPDLKTYRQQIIFDLLFKRKNLVTLNPTNSTLNVDLTDIIHPNYSNKTIGLRLISKALHDMTDACVSVLLKSQVLTIPLFIEPPSVKNEVIVFSLTPDFYNYLSRVYFTNDRSELIVGDADPLKFIPSRIALLFYWHILRFSQMDCENFTLSVQELIEIVQSKIDRKRSSFTYVNKDILCPIQEILKGTDAEFEFRPVKRDSDARVLEIMIYGYKTHSQLKQEFRDEVYRLTFGESLQTSPKLNTMHRIDQPYSLQKKLSDWEIVSNHATQSNESSYLYSWFDHHSSQ